MRLQAILSLALDTNSASTWTTVYYLATWSALHNALASRHTLPSLSHSHHHNQPPPEDEERRHFLPITKSPFCWCCISGRRQLEPLNWRRQRCWWWFLAVSRRCWGAKVHKEHICLAVNRAFVDFNLERMHEKDFRKATLHPNGETKIWRFWSLLVKQDGVRDKGW